MADENEAATTPKVNGAEVQWDGVLQLRKPVNNADGVMVDKLTFREPTGADIALCGMPVLPNLTIDTGPMTDMMARLAGVPTSTIRGLPAKDWTTGAYKIFRFFTPDVFPSIT
jgi:hypothetical protein